MLIRIIHSIKNLGQSAYLTYKENELKSKIDCMGTDVRLRGAISKPFGGFVSIGESSVIRGAIVCNLESSRIVINRNCFIGGETLIDCAMDISIGKNTLIASRVVIMDHNSHSVYKELRKNDLYAHIHNKKNWGLVNKKPVAIGDNCWIGLGSIILKGVELGDGCVVAAGSVVTKSFPDNSLIGGNPGKLIRVIKQIE